MTDYVIKVENLGKSYQIRHKQESYTALRDVLADGAKNAGRALLRRNQRRTQETIEDFWALKDVSFEVKQGERLGIIGRNGAGKSTLLKVLSRITQPTRGEVRLRGRVASLLEVGTGFHPELTGRENIYLNGAILGMTREEIRRKFDEIVAFSEVERFLDTPVKRYSSGMYVRLAFAVAAHLEPEILLVDEVLAVGDAEFQKKCLGKMDEVAIEYGRTVLLVSHNVGAIKRLCPRTLYLQQGHLQFVGSTDQAISEYISQGLEIRNCITWDENDRSAGDRYLRLRSVSLKNSAGYLSRDFDFLETIVIELKYVVLEEARTRLTVWIYNDDGSLLFYTGESESSADIPLKSAGNYVAVCTIPDHLLNGDQYFVSVRADIPNVHAILALEGIITFEVHATSGIAARRDGIYGIICPRVQWDTQLELPFGPQNDEVG